MKKLLITLGVIAVLIFGGYLYLTRPLPFEVEDVDESVFDLPKRKNPSALSKLEAIFTGSNPLLEAIRKREENRSHLSGLPLDEVNREKVMQKITPDLRRDIATIQEQIRPLLSGYDFYLKSGAIFEEGLPQFEGMQVRARTTTIVAVLDCLQDKKTCDQSLQDIAMVMHFGRKMQTGGMLVSTLIGMVLEQIALDKAIYLERHNISTRPLREYFSKMTFIPADDVRETAVKQEYHLFKNELKRIDEMPLTRSGPLGKLVEDRVVNMMANISIHDDMWIDIAVRILPQSRILDTKKTQKIAKNIYHIAMKGNDPLRLEKMVDAMDDVRENIMGYRMVQALIPQFGGMKDRIRNLYKYNSYIPLAIAE